MLTQLACCPARTRHLRLPAGALPSRQLLTSNRPQTPWPCCWSVSIYSYLEKAAFIKYGVGRVTTANMCSVFSVSDSELSEKVRHNHEILLL